MRKNWIPLALVFACLFALPYTAAAQARQPRVEVFGGYAMLRPDFGKYNAQLNNVMGWGLSVNNNVYRGFGLTVDSAGFYRKIQTTSSHTKASAYSFMAGPTVSFRTQKVTPFIHVLAGVGILSGRETSFTSNKRFSDHAFAGAIGGGLDVPVGRHVAIRAIEADYFPVHHESGGNFHNIRWRSGIVFGFGGN